MPRPPQPRIAAFGRVGPHGRPDYRRGKRSYLAVAVCPRCSWAEECQRGGPPARCSEGMLP